MFSFFQILLKLENRRKGREQAEADQRRTRPTLYSESYPPLFCRLPDTTTLLRFKINTLTPSERETKHFAFPFPLFSCFLCNTTSLQAIAIAHEKEARFSFTNARHCVLYCMSYSNAMILFSSLQYSLVAFPSMSFSKRFLAKA